MFKFLKTGFQKITSALKKTGDLLGNRLRAIFKRPLDEENIEILERLLYEADLGSQIVTQFIDHIQKFHKKMPNAKEEEYIRELQNLSFEILSRPPTIVGNEPMPGSPKILLIVGVNGSGKTTTIAKLAKVYQDEGHKVLLAAADTFRAAAIDQLAIWSKRIGTEIVLGAPGGDPSSVLYDAISKAKAKQFDIILCDTAGRLESRSDLMKELEKMVRVAKKHDELGPHETYLIIDAGLGQTAIEQARIFNQFVKVTGLILTKIDGSAKGGVALAIYKELGIPIKFIGTGEKVDDLTPFDAKSYSEALFYA